MTYTVYYRDGEDCTYALAEEFNTSHAISTALDNARTYDAQEIYVEDETGTVVFQCYPDGDNITVPRNFTL